MENLVDTQFETIVLKFIKGFLKLKNIKDVKANIIDSDGKITTYQLLSEKILSIVLHPYADLPVGLKDNILDAIEEIEALVHPVGYTRSEEDKLKHKPKDADKEGTWNPSLNSLLAVKEMSFF